MFLNTELGAAVYYNNTSNQISGNPVIAQDMYNYLDAKWLNGENIEYGGDGIVGTNDQNTSFMFTGETIFDFRTVGQYVSQLAVPSVIGQ